MYELYRSRGRSRTEREHRVRELLECNGRKKKLGLSMLPRASRSHQDQSIVCTFYSLIIEIF